MEARVRRSLEELTAFHEAGHAVVGAAFGRRIGDMFIRSRPLDGSEVAHDDAEREVLEVVRAEGADWHGATYTRSGPEPGSGAALALLAQGAAGVVADRIANGGPLPQRVALARGSSDWTMALEIATAAARGDLGVTAASLTWGRAAAERVLADPEVWRLVERLAARLRAEREIGEADVARVFAQNPAALARAREIARGESSSP